jgi:prolipoprotein diacylglyceryltransferase
MTPTESLAAAQLALYILLIIPVLFVLQQHSKHGLLVWGFLTAFCILRITGSGLEISSPTGKTAQIINGVGLSPLVLAFTGVLHEV